ncbi:hypothetical protein C3B61_03895 [Cryobacterium zongtaii]|uniref:Uncharacterized protein n=1 Tax=Cryobacterium zongtaii TaxID=1259217 RepID=A0A2S3ZLV0_9MICO|nr:hypothetical protein C3B61_03895 [Cryobacterium zongtaii]
MVPTTMGLHVAPQPRMEMSVLSMIWLLSSHFFASLPSVEQAVSPTAERAAVTNAAVSLVRY